PRSLSGEAIRGPVQLEASLLARRWPRRRTPGGLRSKCRHLISAAAAKKLSRTGQKTLQASRGGVITGPGQRFFSPPRSRASGGRGERIAREAGASQGLQISDVT